MSSRQVVFRKRHRKSRLGCAECKRRHIRCDESRPSCLNCRSSKVSCPYLRGSAHAASVDNASHPQQPASSVANPPAADQSQTLSPLIPSPSTPAGIHDLSSDFDAAHLKTFYHFLNETCRPIPAKSEHVELYRRTVACHAFQHSFLMSGVLALGALHLSTTMTDTQDKDRYRNLSTALLVKGLRGFNESLPLLSADTCTAFVMFAHLVGLQSFCSLIMAKETSVGKFLSQLTQTINLLRGIRSIISPWWDTMLKSDFGSMMVVGSEERHNALETGVVSEQLSELFTHGDMSDSARKTYDEALRRLQKELNCPDMTDMDDSTFAVFSWLITTPPEFNSLLEERRPEALVLLAWFAVILHQHRKSWIIRDGGRYIFDLIEVHLGSRWEKWIAWPKAQLLLDQDRYQASRNDRK
ncbi:hypothetical protein K461DRAFT_324885 [Myriangium duriaei CBS 260.36]|uniref:Zn(2)-C6 fungal-type domain-containing protein n=1 Tax=Myriangium duriaei CBS 260.36 TaxID=1168546 RepID=A0A9P4IXC2_9PEZI|nr:hypothetical protein K461DRAFT_324885 [Myriangium duriaei CBS 260.36]